MHSVFSDNPPELQTLKKQPKPHTHFSRAVASVQSQISAHPFFWLFVSFLWIQIAVIAVTRRSPISSLPENFPSRPVLSGIAPAGPVLSVDADCPSGRVYVYDLPPSFNHDLKIPDCDDLDPWKWQCGLFTNNGYGNSAAKDLAGIMPENLASDWYRTNQFSLEIIFHQRIMNYKCRTAEPDSAMAFYIPFYAGIAVGKYLWINDTEKRDWHCNKMLEWVQEKKYWKKFNGSDHFITLSRITWDFRRLTDPGQQWGSSFLNLPAMQKVTRFTIERAQGEEHEIGVPYPTGFHPTSESQLKQWQGFVRNRNRPSLFTFIGAARSGGGNDFRSILMTHCRNESDACRVVDCELTQCSINSTAVQEALLSSDFCLQPRGDSLTRKSVFDCMLAGSIPVFFWNRTAYDQYNWFFPRKRESYSVFIDNEDVQNRKTSIRAVLEGYSKEKVRKMRKKVIETIPRIVYAKANDGLKGFRDAFDIAVDGILSRIKEQKEWSDEEW